MTDPESYMSGSECYDDGLMGMSGGCLGQVATQVFRSGSQIGQVWFDLEGSKSIIITNTVTNQGRYRAGRAAKTAINQKMIPCCENSVVLPIITFDNYE